MENNNLDDAYSFYDITLTHLGGLYTWAAAMGGEEVNNTTPGIRQGICPDGWHLPSSTEWNQLENYLKNEGYNYNPGTVLKSETGWDDDGNGSDLYKFTAIPAGIRLHTGTFSSSGKQTNWWSSTEKDLRYAKSYSIKSKDILGTKWDRLLIDNLLKSSGASVRCIRDIGKIGTSPYCISKSARSITDTSSVLFGNIVNNGGDSILERGFVISTDSAFNPKEGMFILDSLKDIGEFQIGVDNLEPETQYFFRCFARNKHGFRYGYEMQFTTDKSLGFGQVMDIEGNKYKTIKIGDQTWMAENLKVRFYPDSTAIPYKENDKDWAALRDNNYDDACCFYNNDTSSIYGALYSWSAAMGDNGVGTLANPSGIQGVCPDGWHLPSVREWLELYKHLASAGYENNQGLALKAMTGWENNGNGSYRSGFEGLPGGQRYYEYVSGKSVNAGTHAYFWSASEQTSKYHSYATILRHNTSEMNVQFSANWKSSGYSVRCVKNE